MVMIRSIDLSYLAPYRLQSTVQLTKLICQSYAYENEEQIDEVP